MNDIGLNLDMSFGNSIDKNRFQGFGNTYREEGLTISSTTVRLYGEELPIEVTFEDLIIGRKIGQGACSTVNIGVHRDTGVKYAVKMFNVYDEKQARQLSKEIAVLATVQCDALVAMKGAFHHLGDLGIILEYMDCGSLEYILEKSAHFNEVSIAAIAFQVLWGLGYLHFDRRLHRDIKPGNVLLNSDGLVKLSDFGISRELEGSVALSGTVVGTFRYMSPERLQGDDYDYKSDIWSVGILLTHLWLGEHPFERHTATPLDLLSELEYVCMGDVISVKKFPRGLRDVILSMLQSLPENRPSCVDLAENLWFEDCGIASLNSAHQIVKEWLDEINLCKAREEGAYLSRREEDKLSTSYNRDDNYEDDFYDEGSPLSINKKSIRSHSPSSLKINRSASPKIETREMCKSGVGGEYKFDAVSYQRHK